MSTIPPSDRCPRPPERDPGATCDECGVFGAFDFGHVKLCGGCYEGKGSCCPEFGKDDLWQAHENSGKTERKA